MTRCFPARHASPIDASALFALLVVTVLAFASVAHAQLVHFAPGALSVVPRLLLANTAPSRNSIPSVVTVPSLRIAYHDSWDEAADRVGLAFDRVFVSVSTSDITHGEVSLLGASRNELGVAREQIRPLTEFEAGMLAAGALGVAVQLALYLEPSGDAHVATGPRPIAELVIVPGGVLARAWF